VQDFNSIKLLVRPKAVYDFNSMRIHVNFLWLFKIYVYINMAVCCLCTECL